MKIFDIPSGKEIVGCFKLDMNGFEVSATTMQRVEIAVFRKHSNKALALFPPTAQGMADAIEYAFGIRGEN